MPVLKHVECLQQVGWRLSLWARVLIPPPLAVGYAVCFVVIAALGNKAVPLLTDLGDSRLVYFSAAVFSTFAGFASGAPGPFWSGPRTLRSTAMATSWAAVLVLLAAIPAAGLMLGHGVSVAVITCAVSVSLAAALTGALLLGRVHCGYAPIAVTATAMFSVYSPWSPLFFGWMFDPGMAREHVGLSLAALVCSLAAWATWGDLSDDTSAR